MPLSLLDLVFFLTFYLRFDIIVLETVNVTNFRRAQGTILLPLLKQKQQSPSETTLLPTCEDDSPVFSVDLRLK